MEFDTIIKINNQEITKKYIQSLSYDEREALIDPIFHEFRKLEFMYPDSEKEIKSDWNNLLKYNPDTSVDSTYGNSSMATSICKYFCHEYYETTDGKGKTIPELFNDD